MKKLRIGILGAANIATRSVIPAILELPEIYDFVGVATRNISKEQELTSKFSCQVFEGYDSILYKDIIDAVYIPLPNSLHFQWVKESLQKGIHVLVEKSLAMSLEEVTELTHLSNKKNVALVENFQFRFHTQLQVLKKQLESNIIGELKYMRSSFEFPPFPDKTNIRYDANLGGGALYDAGAYPVKISQIILGNDIDVKASSMHIDRTMGVDIYGGAFLKQKNSSLFSEISFGFDNYYRCNVELFGTKGIISTERIFTAPPGFEPSILIKVAGEDSMVINVPSCNHFMNMLQHFYKVVSNPGLIQQENIDNINQSKLLQNIYEQAS